LTIFILVSLPDIGDSLLRAAHVRKGVAAH
jgi:hypothetical protein